MAFSRNIPTVVSIVCKGEDCKCILLMPLIGIIASIYILNFCCDGGGRCEFVMGGGYHQSTRLVIFHIPELFFT